MRRYAAFALLAIARVLSSPAFGQTPADTQPVDLRKVDQGVADRGPLSTSTRSLQTDLRSGGDFRTLYQIPLTANSIYAGYYVRRSGGVLVVFPQSTYSLSRAGVIPSLPPNAIYLLGNEQTLMKLGAAPVVSQLENKLATALSTIVDTSVVEPQREPDRPPGRKTDSTALDKPTADKPGQSRPGPAKPRDDPEQRRQSLQNDALLLVTDARERARWISRMLRLSPPEQSGPTGDTGPATKPVAKPDDAAKK